MVPVPCPPSCLLSRFLYQWQPHRFFFGIYRKVKFLITGEKRKEADLLSVSPPSTLGVGYH